MCSTLMYAYHTENVDTPDDFRAELIKLILGMRRTVEKYSHTRG